MYIREIVTTNKKTQRQYVKHVLVESVRTLKGPRQKTVMPLGSLELPKSKWKALAACLERKLSGQTSLFAEEPALEEIALRAIDQYKVVEQKQAERDVRQEGQQLKTVDLNSVATSHHRSLGPELVVHETWRSLNMDSILTSCGFAPKERALAEAVVACRLIDPGSDLSSWGWLRERTALLELLPVNLEDIGKDAVYEIADRLLLSKQEIEDALYREEQRQFFSGEPSIFLYDLTNTYFAGECANNSLGKRAKSKEKRSDCPLVALALMVDQKGFPVFSQVYRGNQSEPETLESVLHRLEKDIPPLLARPTLIMDRGIATKDNLRLISDRGYPYTVIERRQAEQDYTEEFRSLDSFQRIGTAEEPIYVKKLLEGDVAKVLCLSYRRHCKEAGMDRLKEERFIEDMTKIARSVEKGSLKRQDKVWQRIGRVHEKYPSVAKYYAVTTQNKDQDIVSVGWHLKEVARHTRDILTGCYVIESTQKELSAQEIWRMYMTIQRVESAFRSLKSTLGLRPIHHQRADRTEGHLFISVLAYHLLNTIEHKLQKQGDNRRWSTLRTALSTHQRSTVILTDDEGKIHHLRISGTPESTHQDIYRKLAITNLPRRQLSYVATRL
ncbi:MAG: hypothetical protein DDT26_02505 [Dehalococcoidia bacterium]|nr:hypothetical protein [Chloroflexota bacterium]